MKPWIPLGICVALLAAFALSSKVTFAGKPILTLGHLYGPLTDIIAPFRTSGRFIWPLHYLWITATIALWVTYYKASEFIIYLVFLSIIILQIVDFRGPFLHWYYGYHQRKQPFIVQMDDWQHANSLYKHIILYPPQILGGNLPGCVMPEFEPDYYVPLAYQAYRLNMTFNSGYFARIDESKGRKYCKELHEEIAEGRFANDTIYVIHSQYWELIKMHISKISCGRLNNNIVCISGQNYDVFRDFLVQSKVE